jgi:tRNA(Ile)-lysidine synthetase-like protein
VAQSAPRTIVAAVRAFARQHSIFRPGPVVVAVSGGTDSVALALILAELREEFGLVLHVAHFDHRTRPRSAPKDAAFVADLANHIGAPIRVGRASRAPTSEDDARTDRYAFLRRFASEIGAGAIATGHTMDDQAETVLLHLTRGAGLAGAAGMRPVRDVIARPLLAIGRAQTRAMCAAAKIRPREDPSNVSLRFARNRVRLRVLPELERINPRVRAALARFADAAAEFEGALSSDANDASDSRRRDSGAGIDVPTADRAELDLRTLPTDPALRERALADAWVAAGGITLSASHRIALVKLASRSDGSQRVDLPGGHVMREYSRLIFVRGTAAVASAPGSAPSVHAAVALERGAQVIWHGWRITLDMPVNGTPHAGGVDASSATHLGVRARRPGDRIANVGKLQDVFVDAKVPARERDTWPLVTLNDAVIWVPGVTTPPQSGRIAIAAEPVPDRPTNGERPRASYLPIRQVASKAVQRPRGEKRGRP